MLTELSHGTASAGYLAFAVLVLARTSGSRVAGTMAFAALATAFWAASVPLIDAFALPGVFEGSAETARDGGWFALLLLLMNPGHAASRQRIVLAIAACAILTLDGAYQLALLPAFRFAGITVETALTRTACAVVGLVLVENLLRNAPPDRLWSLKFLGIAVICTQSLTLLVRIPEFLTHQPLADLLTVRPLVYLMILPLLVVTAIRSPSLLLKVHTSRKIVFHSATLVCVGIILQGAALAALYVRVFGGTDGTILAVTIGFGAVVAVTTGLASTAMRSRLRLFVNENFFSYKYDYRLEWERFIRCHAAWQDGTASSRALRTLADLLDSPGGVLWVAETAEDDLLPLARWSFPGEITALPADDAAVEYFRDAEHSFLELGREATADSAVAGAIWKRRFPTGWLVVPLPYRGSLVGIALLYPPRAGRRLDWEDQKLIGLVAMELGAFLDQDRTTRALSDAVQLEEFNKRTAFIVHDLKNTAGQLSLVVQNAQKFGDDEDFRRDMLMTVGEAAARLRDLLARLKQNETQAPTTETIVPAVPGGPIDLLPLMRRFVEKKQARGMPVDLVTTCASVPAVIDDSAFMRVLEHVVGNALDATETGGRVQIVLKTQDDGIYIQVIDHGPGMTQDFIASELFRPFRTGKRTGLGIGAYQAKQLMRDLGGDIRVDSELDVGTRVLLKLPVGLSAKETIQV